MKIAVLLGDSEIETLIRARSLARALLAATPLVGGHPAVTIGLPVFDDALWRRDAAWLACGLPDVIVRRMDWQKVPAGNALRMHQSRPPAVQMARFGHVMLPRDWGNNFTDCDAWVVLADPALGGVYPIRPAAFVCAELAARRSPYSFSNDMRAPYWDNVQAAFAMWRQAGTVVTTDRLTASDIVGFAGVSPDRLLHLPHAFDIAEIAGVRPAPREARRLLIRMEPDSLHDIDAALRGLHLYRHEGGAFVPVIAGQGPAEAWGSASNVAAVAVLPGNVRDMLNNMANPAAEQMAGSSTERLTTPDRWARLLGRAGAVWSPRLSGQGSHLAWPLRLGLPLLSADHPAARDHAARAGAQLALYRPGSPDAVADALHAFEAAQRDFKPAAGPPPDLLAAQAGLIVDRLLEMVDA